MAKPWQKSHSHHELHASGHHYGSEREGVRADGGHHNGRDIGMDHGSSRCSSVGRAARGGGNYYTCIETKPHIYIYFHGSWTLVKANEKTIMYCDLFELEEKSNQTLR